MTLDEKAQLVKERTHAIEVIAELLRKAAAKDEDCEQIDDEDECFRLHPIHPLAWHKDVITMVECDVEGLARWIYETFVDNGGEDPLCASSLTPSS